MTTDTVRLACVDTEPTLLKSVPAPQSTESADTSPQGKTGDSTTAGSAMAKPPSYDALGFDIAAVSPQAACDLILQFAYEGCSRQVHLCNAYTLTLARRDPELARALRSSDLNLPDGVPVAWLGRNAGTTGSVRGPGLTADVFMAGIAKDGRPGVRHYLYGGAPGVADAMADELRNRDLRVDIVGIESPPFRLPTGYELAELAQRIKESGADIVWVGLGTPRQDYVVAMLAPLVSTTLIPVGAAFDFISGRVTEAPKFLHSSGFEWLYRLSKEPRRLWRRYVVDGALFVAILTSQRAFSWWR